LWWTPSITQKAKKCKHYDQIVFAQPPDRRHGDGGHVELRGPFTTEATLAKYDPLREHLARGSASAEMSFSEVGRLVGGLPPSAYRLPAWWSNNSNHHVQARAWLDAGRRVGSINFRSQHVVFSVSESKR
jgi:hypothetical protein